MKRFLVFAAVFLGLGVLLWIFMAKGSPLPISAKVVGRTNHWSGPLRYLVAITNTGSSGRVEGMIEGEMVPSGRWTNNLPLTGRHFFHFNLRPGEGGLFGCVAESNRTEKILVSYSEDTEFTAVINKLRELRKFRAKAPRDNIPNARSLWLEVPSP
jgi:hypothetical protein